MLPRKKRISSFLHKKLKTGRLYHSDLFSLKVFSVPAGESPRFSVIVSKKVAASAVRRNKIKRRASSALEKFGKTSGEPVAAIFWAKRPAAEAGFHDILSDISSLLKKAGAAK